MQTPNTQLIVDGSPTTDTWQHLSDDQAVPATGDITVSLARFRSESGQLVERDGAIGIRCLPSDLAGDIAPLLGKVALVVFDLATFMDGRYFSTARLLRERHGYTGEIRVRGAVTPDQLYFMRRCGINGYEVAAGHQLESALAAFSTFSVQYQGAVDEPLPLFRRR